MVAEKSSEAVTVSVSVKVAATPVKAVPSVAVKPAAYVLKKSPSAIEIVPVAVAVAVPGESSFSVTLAA